ncbi:hypothetical protein [Granulicella arctica]|uniref:Lipoprotein n=1 Tax=Granulicella arctica TaxID=940613 RepID=A0A7Y9TH51_9BACT|nr:hypothetical protein [Granulicella arctica]NYF80199.1 hypothetical protein [Granulicella arctica]
MKKVVVASLLAVASIAPATQMLFAAPLGNPFVMQAAAPAGGGIQMSPAEYKAYNDAISQTTPQTKAPALEAYLTAYPQSAVKTDTLQQLMLAYSAFDPTKTVDAADRLLAVDPNNLRALTFEVYFRKQLSDQITDPTAKQAALDKAADFGTKGLAATKPAEMSDADFTAVKTAGTPLFYSAIGAAALNKKDAATAITNYKAELAAVPVDQTTKPGQILQDTYYLGSAYLQSTPPDLLNCAFYVARFVAFAPEPYKTQMAPTAQYCYKKFHGSADGYDTLAAAAQANVNPPATLNVTPAPKASDIAHQTVTSTSDLAALALSDKEFIIQNGTAEDAQKVFDAIKGKEVSVPDATVVAVTESQVQVAVSDDAVQATPKVADFTFNLKEPLKTLPAVGDKVTLTGTYDSFTQSPLMITMANSEIVPKKAPVKKAAPVHHRATH